MSYAISNEDKLRLARLLPVSKDVFFAVLQDTSDLEASFEAAESREASFQRA